MKPASGSLPICVTTTPSHPPNLKWPENEAKPASPSTTFLLFHISNKSAPIMRKSTSKPTTCFEIRTAHHAELDVCPSDLCPIPLLTFHLLHFTSRFLHLTLSPATRYLVVAFLTFGVPPSLFIKGANSFCRAGFSSIA